MARLLTRQGYDVATVADRERAQMLAACDDVPFDLVFNDGVLGAASSVIGASA